MQTEPRKLVLLAEDDGAVRELAAEVLRSSGYGVLEATDALEAFELAAKHGPDLAVLDIAMPCLGGFDASRRLEAPVIFISAAREQVERLRERVAEALAA